MSDGQAKAGGQIGKNGEFYAGGQFLPNTTSGKKAPAKKRKTFGKQEIENYVWQIAPAPGLVALYGRFRGLTDAQHRPNERLDWSYYNRAQVETDAAAYAEGKRWYDLEDGTYS